MIRFFLPLFLLSFLTFSGSRAASPVTDPHQYSLPAGFIKNNGQFHDQNAKLRNDILYVFSNNGLRLILRKDGFSYELASTVPANGNNDESGSPQDRKNDEDIDDPAVKLLTNRIDVAFVNPGRNMTVEGSENLPYYFNYCTQDVPINQVPISQKITYANVYEGIDLVFYIREESSGRHSLKYDWIIHENGNAAAIALAYRGMKEMKLRPDGSLYLGHEIGFVTEGKPIIRNEATGETITGNYKLEGTTVSYSNLKHKDGNDIVIDPTISWGIILGGALRELPDDIILDKAEHVYVTGRCTSETLYLNGQPVASTGPDNLNDAFLAKFDINNNLIWCTFYGGLVDEKPLAICLDPLTQEPILGGKTTSANGIAFNCTNDETDWSSDAYYGGDMDGFVAKFTTSGTIIRSTYIGASKQEYVPRSFLFCGYCRQGMDLCRWFR
jgi:hypothetical protein